MISLSRLDGTKVIVNAELIKFIEEIPDTVLTLRDGERVMVSEAANVVVERAIVYGQSIRGVTPA